MIKSTLSRILLICCLCICMSGARAQYVAIPDSNFGNWLDTSGYSSCLTGNGTVGWQLDTTCPAALAATSMIFTNMNPQIENLQGIQYFKHLNSLTCYVTQIIILPVLPEALDTLIWFENQSLSILPALPATLKYFSCEGCEEGSLPALPNGLKYLDCSRNDGAFLSLPPLPDSLVYLNCSTNSLLSLPSLPPFLVYLNCSLNSLDSLPTLPITLTYLDCTENNLTVLPALPAKLDTFMCASNNLLSLPTLPDSLHVLECGPNQLDSLPALPSTLLYFGCGGNKIRTLPALPGSLTFFECSANLLTSIPPLPVFMTYFNCESNDSLYCMPHLDTIQQLYFSATGVTCLPDYPTGNIICYPSLSNFPLCSSGTCNPLSIDDLGMNNTKLSVYPNPATDKLYCNFDLINYSVSIFDLTGRQVPLSVSDNEIDISDLPSGIYCLHLQNSNGSVVRKFVKE